MIIKQKTEIFLFLLGLVFLDQISKYKIRHSGGFYICNHGIAWGIRIPEWIFYLFWLIIIFFILKQFSKNKHLFILSLILAGAVSNFIDRLFFGCVIDFINLKFWPVFNFADIYISVGAVIIIWRTLIHNK